MASESENMRLLREEGERILRFNAAHGRILAAIAACPRAFGSDCLWHGGPDFPPGVYWWRHGPNPEHRLEVRFSDPDVLEAPAAALTERVADWLERVHEYERNVYLWEPPRNLGGWVPVHNNMTD